MIERPDQASSGGKDARRPRSLIIGITGPIGCGKSTVGRLLGDLGGTVVDADLLARRATDTGQSTLADIRARFGDSVFQPNGELDRARMAAVVFDDPDALADLEAIVHPAVRVLVEQELVQAATDAVPFVVIEAIKLVEGGLADRCDEVWLIECDPATQRRRMLDRGTEAGDADRRIYAQGPDLAGRLAAELKRREGVARVRRLSTEGSLEETRERIEDALADAFEGGTRP